MNPTKKGTHTKAVILQTALNLFLEHGYEATTMRTIAKRANVSLGNFYYYFPSKEHLMQAFYTRVHEEYLVLCTPILTKEKDLKARLRGVLQARIEGLEPYHHLAGVLFATAANPASPLNPFGDEFKPAREQATAVFADVLSGSPTHISKELAAELPSLLWLYQMGLVLFWVHDESLGRARTYKLVDDTVELIVRLISLAQLPLLRNLQKTIVHLVQGLREDLVPAVDVDDSDSDVAVTLASPQPLRTDAPHQ